VTTLVPRVPPDAECGLTAAEAYHRRHLEGANVLVPQPRLAWLRRRVRPFTDPMVLLLLVAAPTYAAIGERRDAVVSVIALGPILAVDWLLEARAGRALQELRALTSPVARVCRDGTYDDVAVEDVVRGDLLEVREGDVVAADARVVDASQLLVDESGLTGEPFPVGKAVVDGPDGLLLAGTTVVSGRGIARVSATGPRTQYGQIGALLGAVRPSPTPLQHAANRLVRFLGGLALVLCVAVATAELARGRGWGTAVIAAVSLGLAAVPEEFPMVYTLYLSLGAWRLARDRALVRNLPSVETLGSTTVICTDKTGTLTTGQVGVAEARCVAGVELVELLEAAVLACEPDPFDPLDTALVAHARDHGVDVDGLHAGQLVADWPFEAASKHLTHVWRRADEVVVAAKGSIEGLGAITGADRDLALIHEELAARGLRVIAVAGGMLPNGPTGSRDGDEDGLRLLGLIGFEDPLRVGVEAALGACSAAGVRVVVITGDHPTTAHAVVETLALPHGDAAGDRIAVGDDIDAALADGTLPDLVTTTNVFARTRPDQKHALVQALRAQGEVVAMTGDGVNDAPALREADIGVAMGRRGTEVARAAADIVLLDDNFATIVSAVRDGRRIFDNLVRAFAYLVAFHPPLFVAALVVPLAGRPLLLLPVHLVLLELILHPAVSLVFQAEPPAPDVMRRPPRDVAEGMAGRRLARPAWTGLSLAAAVVAVYLVALVQRWPAPEARGLAWATLLLGETAQLLAVRSPDRALWRGFVLTRTLAAILALMVATALGTVLLPAAASVLRLASFPAWGWAVAVLVAAASTLWSEPLKGRRAAQ
jgi:Ca2+-transporting ATPase